MLKHRPSSDVLIALGVGAAVLLVTWMLGDGFFELRPIRLAFDTIDLTVYFRQSEWAVSEGVLPFRDIFSEYPLAANLMFGAVRLLSDHLPAFSDPFKSFSWWWMGIAGVGYGFGAAKLTKEGWLPLAAWLSPAVLYFSALRFDLYPALATLLALWAIREERYRSGALWLGLCIAIKGYAAIALPAFGVFLVYRVGFRRALGLSALAIAPMVISLLLVWLYAGLDGALMPFRWHADRPYNEESAWVAVDTLLRGGAANLFEQMRVARIPTLIQIGFGLLAAALRPKTFDQLVHAFLVAIAGFAVASVFHSPQFVLWIVAVAVFATNRYTLVLAIALGWVGYLYFPILFDLREHPLRPDHVRGAYELSILGLVVLKLLLMFRPRFPRRAVREQAASTTP